MEPFPAYGKKEQNVITFFFFSLKLNNIKEKEDKRIQGKKDEK